MSWTYSGNPTTSDRDAVRFWLQDTDDAMQLVQNEEIDYVLSVSNPVWGNVIAAAAICADVIVGKFSKEASVSADGVSIDWSGVVSNYRALAQSLRDQLDEILGAGALPLGFGYDLVNPANPGVRPPSFGKGFTDNPFAGNQEYGDRNHDPEYGGYGWPDSGYWTGP